MFRVRRYRYFVIFAALLLLILYQVTRKSERWADLSEPLPYKPLEKSPSESGPVKKPANNEERPDSKERSDQHHEATSTELSDKTSVIDVQIPTTPAPAKPTRTDDFDAVRQTGKTTSAPVIELPDRVTPEEKWNNGFDENGVWHHGPSVPKKATTTSPTTTIHWSKMPEHFPIASDAIIPLPTGKPKDIPRIQHDFDEESADVRERRETRLAKVKAEMKRAWTGYKTYAWTHDELSPVSKAFRDPFCGWAATLVDSLDTLWIMGMKTEFEDAVEAVKEIDFTHTERTDIPVFETVIRYLGGLLGAYDVSGGEYQVLLDKAVELAEILMGIFDTPNRMPVLYYNWRPMSASRAKSAGSGVSVAELGSLLMEFTRLAQVTKDNRYYDAVARITDEFEDWQNRGTSLPGLFPERIDATGCNKTASVEAADKLAAQAEEEAQSPLSNLGGGDATDYSNEGQSASTDMDEPVLAKQQFRQRQRAPSSESSVLYRRSSSFDADEHPPLSEPSLGTVEEKDLLGSESLSLSPPEIYRRRLSEGTAEPYRAGELSPKECYPQGLAPSSSRGSYSLGGSQDSTYEYFPKEFLLLGGLEPKYRAIHLKVAEAAKKWLLYRPMVPDDRNILFSAKLSTQGDPENDASTDFEVTHLTCFLGGMFAMGGKIFEDPVDVEIGSRLTDGCIWAYETTPSGIMPEGATVAPCAQVNNCHWNETLYWQYLDPQWTSRGLQMEDYKTRMEEYKKELQVQEQEELRRQAEAEAAVDDSQELDNETSTSHQIPEERKPGTDREYTVGSPDTRKRDVASAAEDDVETGSNDNLTPAKIRKNPAGTKAEVAAAAIAENDKKLAKAKPTLREPKKPMTHEEYVLDKIEREHLPPGFVTVNYRKYILRPEAIESVWYMYRITGDSYWQEKGWKMFEAIIRATQTEAGHSAIGNVLLPNSDKDNSMESFWTAETLKYFYLLYTTPDVISLDEWVLNTEAHPFKRPSSSSSSATS